MLNKIKKRIEQEVDKIIKKETLTQEDYNFLSRERNYWQGIKEQKEREKYSKNIFGLTEKLVGNVCKEI